MRIVIISDTHSMHDAVNLPDGDVLIHAGDSTMVGEIEEVAAFNEWLGTLPHKHKIVIAGNHDWLFERSPDLAGALMTNAIYLRDESVTVDGVTFYGSPWTPWFMDWAFNVVGSDGLREKWEMIPDETDVLITHGPPFGIMDAVPRSGGRGYSNEGCQELQAALLRVQPRIHAFGHIHEGYGTLERDGTLFVNASICNPEYYPVNKPVLLSDVV